MSGTLHPLIEQAIGRRIKYGLSIRTAASEAGMSFSAWARLERGLGWPNLETQEKLGRWLKGLPAVPSNRGARSISGSWAGVIEDRVATLEIECQRLREVVSRVVKA